MSDVDYLFIQLWAPKAECDDPEKPHYVMSVPQEPGFRWTLTREFGEAHNFKKQVTAERVIRAVRRIADRVARGWLYEIIRVEETIVDTNVPEKAEEKEVA